MNQGWQNGGSNFVATPASTAPSPTGFGKLVPPANTGYGGYSASQANAYPVRPGIPPPPGPLQTYGSTVAKTAAVEQSKQQASGAGYLTAADLVAGINTKFKNATKDGFSVPKR